MYPVGTQRSLRRSITSLMQAPDASQACISVTQNTRISHYSSVKRLHKTQELATTADIEPSGATVERFFYEKN